MFIIKVLLLPFSFLYGIIIYIRNVLFNIGVLKSTSFPIHTISFGNLTVGGTGKTPHIEYLIRLFKNDKNIATLSRGYKRATSGFVLANENTVYTDIGDEPMQFKSKFSDINVAVDEKRRNGIKKILTLLPETDLILLDDCFQHRWVKPGLNLLLIDYSTVDDHQFMLPSGELREWKSGMKRADAIILSKSPQVHSPIEQRRIKEIIQPAPYQKVFFSFTQYQELVPLNAFSKLKHKEPEFNISENKVYLFTGIAKAAPLIDHLKSIAKDVIVSEFQDHHDFKVSDIIKIIDDYNSTLGNNTIFVTTEKDAVRLKDEKLYPLLETYPVFYIPIEVKFHQPQEDEITFDQFVKAYAESTI